MKNKAEKAFEDILANAKKVGDYLKETENDTALIVLGNLDLGDRSAAMYGFSGTEVTGTMVLVKAMKENEDLRKIIEMAVELYPTASKFLDAQSTPEDLNSCKAATVEDLVGNHKPNKNK